jgi:hypothetical protein
MELPKGGNNWNAERDTQKHNETLGATLMILVE